jgi:hypothetical protein
MSLETWLLIAVLVLLIALLGISLLAFPSRLLLERLRYFPDHEEWRRRGFPTRDLEYMIFNHERKFGLRLTPYARQMLIIPIEEQVNERQRRVDIGVLDQSISKIFEALKEDSDAASKSPEERYNSVGVIKAFHKRFCNIPPFCASTEGESSDVR